MSKGLEALNNLEKAFDLHYTVDYIEDDDATIIKKELKVLEIIKTKNVNIVELKMSSTVKQYNNAISFMMFYKKEYELTQAEFDLLLEVL